jgi:hypothetical protein
LATSNFISLLSSGGKKHRIFVVSERSLRRARHSLFVFIATPLRLFRILSFSLTSFTFTNLSNRKQKKKEIEIKKAHIFYINKKKKRRKKKPLSFMTSFVELFVDVDNDDDKKLWLTVSSSHASSKYTPLILSSTEFSDDSLPIFM